MYNRIIDFNALLEHRSIFLFGPRQTGKSTLLKQRFPAAKYYNLLQADTFRELSAAPENIRQKLSNQDKLVIIDEIQKLPSLLDEVHALIESHKQLRFILTGSSARKLRRGGANLLGGRALTCHLHPLVSPEVNFEKLTERLNNGSLPAVMDSPVAAEDLNSYVGNYLREEIQAEGLVRSIENFSRFLSVAGLCNGEQLNFESVAQDAQVPARTVREYYQILEDTLIGYQLTPYQKTKKRKPVATSKFYLFDVGVANTLLGRSNITPRSEAYGRCIEHFIFLELRAYLDYHRLQIPLTYWRTQSKLEVDFVLGDEIGLEVKASGFVSERETTALNALAEEVKLKRRIIVCSEKEPKVLDNGTEVLPVEEFLKALWNGDII